MFNKPIAYTVVLLYSLLIEIDAHYSNNFLHSRLVNPKFSTDLRDGNVENEVYTRYEAVKLIIPKFKRSRYQFESTSGNSSTVQPTDGSNPQTRFIDFDEDEEDAPQGSDDTKKREPHATTTESSFIDLLIGSDDDDTKKNSEENETDEDNEIDDYEDEDEDEDEDKDGKKEKEGFHDLRGNRKKYTKVHKLIFPLLLAYKLKFFTMVPLLVGSLVLLVGTTGVAGFFFALFAAAMGLHVKTSH